MDFHREHIRALGERRHVEARLLKRVLVRSANRARRQRRIADRALRQVVAVHLNTIQINRHAVIAHDAQVQRGDARGTRDVEGAPEVRRDVFARGTRAVADDRRFIPVAIAQLGRAD